MGVLPLDMSWSDLLSTGLDLLARYRYTTLFLASAVEGAGIPFPLGIMLLAAGGAVVVDSMNFAGALGVFVLGNVLGSITAYYLGRSGAMLLSRARLRAGNRRVTEWIRRYGPGASFIAHILARTARIPMMYAFGAQGVPLAPYVIYTVLGTAVWGAAWLFMGMKFSSWGIALGWIRSYDEELLVAGALILLLLGSLVYFLRRRG